MSPALNGNLEIQYFERSGAFEIRNKIIFNFYTGLICKQMTATCTVMLMYNCMDKYLCDFQLYHRQYIGTFTGLLSSIIPVGPDLYNLLLLVCIYVCVGV